jgi:hypothetical protein
MSTPKQIAANRRNAQKSTGPRTPEGKAACRFNALQSGIDAQAEIIPGEAQDRLESLVAEYQERFDTDTPDRRMLVDTLVHCEWLLRRLRRAEAELWQYESHRTESDFSSNKHPEGRVIYYADRVFERLQRRIDAVTRNYRQALKELTSLEPAAEPGDALPAEPPAPIQPPSNQESIPQIGSVPQSLVQKAEPVAPPAPPAALEPKAEVFSSCYPIK